MNIPNAYCEPVPNIVIMVYKFPNEKIALPNWQFSGL